MKFSSLSCRALAWVLSFIMVLILIPSAGSASQHPTGPAENASDPAFNLSGSDTTGVPPHFFPAQVSPLTVEEHDTDDSNGIETATDSNDLPNDIKTVADFDDLPGDPVDLINPAEPDAPEIDYIETDIEPQPEQDTTAETAGSLTIALTASGGSPILADNAPDFDNNDYYYHDHILYINSGADMTISGSSTLYSIVVRASGGDKNLTLYNVDINMQTNRRAFSAFDMTGATVNLKLLGDNFLTGGSYRAGLEVPDGSTLIVEGTGSLTVRGGSYCAGIGGGDKVSGGNITISGNVDVSATGGSRAAGIGGGYYGSGGNITINGGTVTATGASWAAGIGGGDNGSGGNITINGGTVTAIGFTAIGRGDSGGWNQKITIDMSPNTFRYWINTNKTDPGGNGAINFVNPFVYSSSYSYIKIEQAGTAIGIITQPVENTNVTAGNITDSLEIAAKLWPGGEPAYQWYSNTTASNRGGTLLVGQTSPRFAIPTGLTAGTYYFYCVVSADGVKDISSDVAGVRVYEAGLGDLTIALTASGGSPQLATNAPYFDNNDYYYIYNVLYINSGTEMTISGSSMEDSIVVRAKGGDKNLTLHNAYIYMGKNSRNLSAFDMTGATVNLKLLSDNILIGGPNRAGLEVPDGSTLIVEGTGSLTVWGGNNGAGIGGGYKVSGGNINISGNVDVSAIGGIFAAGIGGGYDGSGGNITINGGTVNARGGGFAAGIGGGNNGSGGNITISGNVDVSARGGTGGAGIGGGSRGSGGNTIINGNTDVSATGGSGAAGIGGGYESSGGNITINGGTVTAISISAAAIGRGDRGGSNEKITIDMSPNTFRYWINTNSTNPGGYGAIDGFNPFVYSNAYRYIKLEQLSDTKLIKITTQPTANTKVTAGIISESLQIAAEVWPGEDLAYQWYSNTTASNSGGTLLVGQTSPHFAIPTGLTAGTYYFYCVVSADGVEDISSDVAGVRVYEAGLGDLTIALTASGGSPQLATNAPYFDNNDYYYISNILYINSGTEMTISGSSKEDNIVVRATGGDKNLTLHNVDIDMGTNNRNLSAFDMTDATVNLKLLGENYLTGDSQHAGLQVPDGSQLIIEGTGSLTVKGGNKSAGIGSTVGEDSGSITILGGTVTAIGGSEGAGIGGGSSGSGGNITISGNADVSATGGSSGASIGGGNGGSGGDITISGDANVSATGGYWAAGIGSGNRGSGGDIAISGNANVSAKGGSRGAGIGGGFHGSGENITISGNVNVSATGGPDTAGIGGAGIGGGEYGSGGNITISGGTVTAITENLYGSAIGRGNRGGSNQKITIDMSPNTFRYWINTNSTDPGGYGAMDCFDPFVNSNAYRYIKLEQLSGTKAIKITTQPTANTNVTAGNINVNLEIAAEVWQEGEPSYQWYSNTTASNSGGTLLTGQTSTAFAIPTGLTPGVYYFYCVASADGAEDRPSDTAGVRVYDVNAVEAFVTRMYLNVLEREPDTEEREYWSAGLKSGHLTAANMADSFFFGLEFLNRSVTDEQFIKIVFNVFIDRELDKDALAHLLSVLERGYSRRFVLNLIMTNPEFTTICEYCGITVGQIYTVESFLTRMYLNVFEREPTQEGLEYWSNALESGPLTAANIAYSFFFSWEFLNRNMTNEDFIKIAYNTLLDRNLDINELLYWTNSFKNGTRFDVLNNIIKSTEFRNRCSDLQIAVGSTRSLPSSTRAKNFVTNMFQNILHRKPGEEGLNYWSNGFISGELTGAGFIGHLFFSNEFLNANVSDLEFITIAHSAIIGSPPDEDSLANWLEVLESGESRGAVLRSMTAGPEFSNICAQYNVTVGAFNYE